MASSETTRERCHNCDDFWFQHRGADNVPQRFRKNTEYRYSSTTGTTGYHAKSREDNRSVAVEFVYNQYVWVEVRWSQITERHGEWEGFRTALEDLGCDIYINELTQEELQELENTINRPTSNTPPPSPSTKSNASLGARSSSPSQQGVNLAIATETLRLGAMATLTSHVQSQATAGSPSGQPIYSLTTSPIAPTVTAFRALADPANQAPAPNAPMGGGGGGKVEEGEVMRWRRRSRTTCWKPASTSTSSASTRTSGT